VPSCKKLWNQNRTEISGTAGDKDFHKAKPIIEKPPKGQDAKKAGIRSSPL
jgi:hypothetical protein